MQVQFSKGCAWRAVYVSREHMPDGYGSHQIFHIGIDPYHRRDKAPALFGAIQNPFNRRSRIGLSWRIPLPYLRWRTERERSFLPGYLAAYRLSQRFWLCMDARNGFKEWARFGPSKAAA